MEQLLFSRSAESVSSDPTASARGSRVFRAILWGGLAVGVLDTLLAVVQYRAPVARVYQSIASGLLGPDAFQGGLATAALGMFLHFFIATTAAAVYVGASLRLPILVRRTIPCGLAYGVAVFFFMRNVVIPLSLVRRGPFNLGLFLGGLIGHAFLVGLPIALATRRAAVLPRTTA